MDQSQQTFLQDLRAATDAKHRQLEQAKISQQLMSAGVTPEQYGTYLSLMRNVMAWAEENIFPLAAQVVDISDRHKVPAIDSDLAKLNMLPFAEPFTVESLAMNEASALGAMYVLEGSTLGGRVILKHLAEHLHLNENNGAAFFYGYGAETGKKWSGFLEAFTQYAVQYDASEAITEAANATFDSIFRYFNYI